MYSRIKKKTKRMKTTNELRRRMVKKTPILQRYYNLIKQYCRGQPAGIFCHNLYEMNVRWKRMAITPLSGFSKSGFFFFFLVCYQISIFFLNSPFYFIFLSYFLRI